MGFEKVLREMIAFSAFEVANCDLKHDPAPANKELRGENEAHDAAV
jgi:hypothetical protein